MLLSALVMTVIFAPIAYGHPVTSHPVDSSKGPGEYGKYFQGDIQFPPVTDNSSATEDEDENPILKNGLRWARRWDEGTIRVYIDQSGFSAEEVTEIRNAMNSLNRYTNLYMWEISSPCSDCNYIYVRSYDEGCFSQTVGCAGTGRQDINLQRYECVRRGMTGIALHEFIHAIGFWHEHARSDRDSYVDIIWRNIRTGSEQQFYKLEASNEVTFGYSYDYGSIMHFAKDAFTRSGADTIVPKNPPGAIIGQRTAMSQTDINKINAMYNGISVWQVGRRKRRAVVTAQ